ncbi:Gfo/Idh/MocA family oxidoreductase [Thermobifida halotolerans]|uniref:Gfo/Idh/MocA family oxidoreductase n=1 Tax=Thermobifida halotolerans TaxID=483545 RepID=A0A399G8W1_9ACTN|nr:Gfo/Idh/MocA family oxidoreductase [Thermobifida halotolerans]UOE20431.1 Gfo/Idh/MocA family oxidoreductase [Thermobifida halotolerans]
MTTDSGVLRWGVLGTGGIATAFLEGLRVVEGARVTAVGSRSEASAARFADAWDIPNRHVGPEALAADPEVDVVYVATPHPAHHAGTLACLEAGKHVLCEKPLAMNVREVTEMIGAARRNGRFLMEAMWTRFAPASREIGRLLADGAIGELRLLTANFGNAVPYDPASRMWAPELGGGALLDLGVYPVALASHFLGELTVVGATGRLAPNGVVDAQATVLVENRDGVTGMLACSLDAPLPNRVALVGTRGRIELERWWCPTDFVLHRDGQEPEAFAFPHRANGYEHEAEEVARRIAAGELESPLMPWEESLRVVRVMDEVRERLGVVYPADAVAA